MESAPDFLSCRRPGTYSDLPCEGQIAQSHSKKDPVLRTGRENDSKSNRKNLNTQDLWALPLLPIPARTILSNQNTA